MTLLDVNILLYAYNPQSQHHERVRPWLEALLSSTDVGIPWISLWGFLRIVTNPRLSMQAARPEAALAVVRDLIARPNVHLVEPGRAHVRILEEMILEGQSSGSRTTDAVLAALAIENGATLASTDKDFSRFPKLKWLNPIA
ncbi:MAG: type II toxin-antitoxin system VapC family toxin [Acidobacteria bacterium]|nr:type II toxin-antitoxin system VapC family toxin [Acidobacteriota bacterium]